MSHLLTTDWTTKIKSNPVANKILNKNRYPPPPSFSKVKKNLWSNWSQPQTKFDYGLNDAGSTFNFGLNDDNDDARSSSRYSELGWDFTMNHHIDRYAERNQEEEYYKQYDEVDDHDDNGFKHGNYWDNTYVQDMINIHHPKIRPCYVAALRGQPVGVKPPSVFFSDV